jgi:hypothetical protein
LAREFTKRGAKFVQLKLQRSTSAYTVRFIVPAAQANVVELGGWYKVAILLDGPPDSSATNRSGIAAEKL